MKRHLQKHPLRSRSDKVVKHFAKGCNCMPKGCQHGANTDAKVIKQSLKKTVTNKLTNIMKMMTERCQDGTRNHNVFKLFEKRFLSAIVSLTKVRRSILRIGGTKIHGQSENKVTTTCFQTWDRKTIEKP